MPYDFAAFDVDGTAIKNEELQQECCQYAIENAGGTFDEVLWKKLLGSGQYGVWQEFGAIYSDFPFRDDFRAFERAWDVNYKNLLQLTHRRRSIVDILDGLARLGVPRAALSNSDDAMVKFSLQHTGLSGAFSDIWGAGSIRKLGCNKKPCPSGYRKLPELLGVEGDITPATHIGFEDSPTGVKALLEANYLAVQFTDAGQKPNKDADIVVGSDIPEAQLARAVLTGRLWKDFGKAAHTVTLPAIVSPAPQPAAHN